MVQDKHQNARLISFHSSSFRIVHDRVQFQMTVNMNVVKKVSKKSVDMPTMWSMLQRLTGSGCGRPPDGTELNGPPSFRPDEIAQTCIYNKKQWMQNLI